MPFGFRDRHCAVARALIFIFVVYPNLAIAVRGSACAEAIASAPVAQIEFQNFKYLLPEKIVALTSSATRLLSGFTHPSFQIHEREEDFLGTDNLIGEVNFIGTVGITHHVNLGFSKRAYPVFVHEYGHITVEASLLRDVPAYAAEIALILEQTELVQKYKELQARESKASAAEMASIKDRWDSLRNKRTFISRFSVFFEEPFADLLVSAVYRKKSDLLVQFGDHSGWRDLTIVNKDSRTMMLGDEHHVLQKLGAHIFVNYLSKEDADEQRIFQVFYELARDQIVEAIESGWLQSGRWEKRHLVNDRETLLNGRNLGEWCKQLILEYDRRMKKPMN